MSAHTPGPWQAEHEQCDPKPFPDDPGFFAINAPILNRYGPVADTMNRDHCISPDEDRANAMLIAAAPDLLVALHELLSLYRTQFGDNSTTTKAHNAIAKAIA
jgi:hypothetical protein